LALQRSTLGGIIRVDLAFRCPSFLVGEDSSGLRISSGQLALTAAETDVCTTVLQTTLLGIPPNVIQVFALLISGYIASRVPNTRVIIMTCGNIACVVAAACMAYLPVQDKWNRLVAFWITPSQSIGFSLSLVMVSANTGGFTKKAFTAATTFVGYCVGNIIGPHFYKPEEAPVYRTAVISMLAGYCIKTFLGIVLGLYMWNENRRRDKLFRDSAGASEKDAVEDGMLDRTEFENPGFRYSL